MKLVIGLTARFTAGLIAFGVLAAVAAAQDPRPQALPGSLSPPGLPGGAEFGTSVGAHGNVLVVGAPEANQGKGEVRTYDLVNGAWVFDELLTAPDGALGDHFGAAIGFNGFNVVVGAPGDDDLGTDSGSVYVFNNIFDVAGPYWGFIDPKLHAFDGAAGDHFGAACGASTSGYFVVGAPGHTTSWVDDGAAYIIEPDQFGNYDQYMAKVLPTAPQYSEGFGSAVAIDGDFAVVGAPGYDTVAPGHTNAGRAVAFKRLNLGSGDFWVKSADLIAPDVNDGRRLGASVAIDSWRIVVGAPGALDSDQEAAGAAYLFDYVGGPSTWGFSEKLSPQSGNAGDAFGSGVAVNPSNAYVAGATRVIDFHNEGSAWPEHSELSAPFADLVNGTVETLGPAIAADDTSIVVGRPSLSAADPGRAFPFWVNGGKWTTLGQGTLGLGGVVKLRGAGPLDDGKSFELRVKYGKANAPGVLFVHAGNASALPFHQGVLYAFVPNLTVPIGLSPTGELSLPAVSPPGIANVKFVLQVFIGDPLAAGGVSMSNGLEVITAP